MENGELENNQEMFSSSNVVGLPLSNGSIDSFFDGLLMDSHHHQHQQQQRACTQDSDEKVSTDDTAESSGKNNGEKRPQGNREAVRKYRAKKKAKATSLEDECSRLRGLNQQLVKRLQNQSALESEVSRLKCLLVDLRGRVDGEIGSFPYQKPVPLSAAIPSFSSHPCNVQCEDDVFCLQHGFGGNNGQEGGGGASINDQGFDQLHCMTDQNLVGNGNGSFTSASNNRRKAGNRAPRAA